MIDGMCSNTMVAVQYSYEPKFYLTKFDYIVKDIPNDIKFERYIYCYNENDFNRLISAWNYHESLFEPRKYSYHTIDT